MEVDYTVSYNMPDDDVEAELIPDPGDASWMPEAGTSEDADGNLLGVRVELHRKGQPAVRPATKATFKFELHGVSKEKGVALNAPTFDRAKEDAGLRIDALESPDLKVEPDGQSAVSTSPGHNARVVVRSHDWGAAIGDEWARLEPPGWAGMLEDLLRRLPAGSDLALLVQQRITAFKTRDVIP